MRKPRDYDAELKALDDKARQLKERKVRQLGELVIACRADGLTAAQLAGLLIGAVESDDRTLKEEWRARGERFFRGEPGTGQNARRSARRASQSGSGTPSADGKTGAS